MNYISNVIRSLLRKSGYDIVKYTSDKHPLARRIKLFGHYNINLILDVGANTGQYGQQVRDIGYTGRIESFEPIKSAFEELNNKAKNDKIWNIHNIALGDTDNTLSINVSNNSQSSSLLEMLPTHCEAFPDSKFISKEQVIIKQLDSIFHDIWSGECGVYLKIDAQGYEKNILCGAINSLSKISTIQLEMSLRPLYSGEPLFSELDQFLNNLGYVLVSVETSWADKLSGELLQFDGIYHKHTL